MTQNLNGTEEFQSFTVLRELQRVHLKSKCRIGLVSTVSVFTCVAMEHSLTLRRPAHLLVLGRRDGSVHPEVVVVGGGGGGGDQGVQNRCDFVLIKMQNQSGLNSICVHLHGAA